MSGTSVRSELKVSLPRAEAAVVELHGEHDIAERDKLSSVLSDLVARNQLVVVDVSDATFIDSSVLHELSSAEKQARTMGKRIVLQMGTAAIVERAFEISGLLQLLDLATTRDQALSRLNAHDLYADIPTTSEHATGVMAETHRARTVSQLREAPWLTD